MTPGNPARTRVLIVDDSVVVRRMLTDLFSAESDIEVAGAAPSGAAALERIKQGSFDVMTCDVEMPGMSGLELLVEVRKLAPQLPVVMFSSLTRRAAETTLEALARGASDYVTKPTGASSRAEALEQIRGPLLSKIRSLVRCPESVLVTRAVTAPAPRSSVTSGERAAPRLLAVGSSTGGPNALATLFSKLQPSFKLPIVVAQHMPPLFTRLLAERLTATCGRPFHEAEQGTVLTPGHGYIAPGDFHLRVGRAGAQEVVLLDQAPPENSCRPAVDVLFRSVAAQFGPAALAVVLTGMGQDGLLGCEQLKQRGAQVLVQDEASSVVWGMPGFVARAGLADAVLPLSEIADEVMRRARWSEASHAS